MIISNRNGVGIWIRMRVHIYSLKSVIVQFQHTPLNVRLYLHIRVEIRPSFSSNQISNRNGVGIWIRMRVHIYSLKSVIVQFHHTPLNVRLYLHIRVEIRPSFSSNQISNRNGVGIWIRMRVHIYSLKSVIVQFHYTPLNVRLYLHIRVEIRPSFSITIRVPLSETKRSDIISASSLWIWRNLHAWIWIMGFVFISIADQNMNSQRSLPPFPLPHPPTHPRTKN